MDFSLSDDQQHLQDEAARVLERAFPLEKVRTLADRAGPRGSSDQDAWRPLCELGVQRLLIDEEYGGLGLGLLDAALVAEQMGRFIVPAPFVANSVMAPLAVSLAGESSQKTRVLPGLAEGSLVAAVAVSEFSSGVRGDAGVSFQGGRLEGSTLFALDWNAPDLLVLADRERRLHLVDAKAPGLTVTALETVDRTRSVCMIECAAVESDPLSRDDGTALARVRDAGRLMLAADTLGCAARMLDMAVQYAGQRVQFGRPIGSFQAVKHMCAEMVAELEPGRALLWYAAYAQDNALPDAALATAHCKAYLCQAGRMVARKATEVHGGIGITDALGLHLWFKRVGWNYQVLGSPERLWGEAGAMQ